MPSRREIQVKGHAHEPHVSSGTPPCISIHTMSPCVVEQTLVQATFESQASL